MAGSIGSPRLQFLSRASSRFSTCAARYGWGAAVQDFGYALANRMLDSLVLEAFVLRPEKVAARLLDIGPEYGFLFLDKGQLVHHGRAHGEELLPPDWENLLALGDRCCGVLHKERLVSFCWFSNRPTPIDAELEVAVDPRYAYGFKSYTDPGYRGRSLQALRAGLAVRALEKDGFLGAVAYVEANNFASLRAVRRSGYERIGRVAVARIAGRFRIWPDQACTRFGFGVRERAL